MQSPKGNVVGGSQLRTSTSPIPTERTVRTLEHRVITSMPAGFSVPLVAFPLLREDALRMSRYRFTFEMAETAEILANGVIVSVSAWVVPFLAFDRFDGMDGLNRSYMKQPAYDGGPVIPFFESTVATIGPQGGSNNEVLYHLGEHFKPGSVYNFSYNEAYTEIWNMRAKNRSPDIPLKTWNQNKLLPAFWPNHPFAACVPDFDQAVIDGEVPLTVTDGRLMVKGLGINDGPVPGAAGALQARVSGNTGVTAGSGWRILGDSGAANAAGKATISIGQDPGKAGWPLIYSELAENGITVSLANIEVARRTQAFAALRKTYEGVDDDYIIDLLMQGIHVPEQQLRQPILLGSRQAVFGMSKRYSSDSVDLTASVVNGAAMVDLAITCPKLSTGGIVMICAEAVPEQLYERQKDALMGTVDQELLPNFLRDTLDPEKVDIVQNGDVDVSHATPTATFGYVPLNWKWNRQPPRIGGRFYRPAVDDPMSEDRMRFWAAESVNPTLSEDFYLVSDLQTNVFVATDEDPFEAVGRGVSVIEGNTVFGRMLLESSDVYDEVMAEAPLDRIDKPATLEATGKPSPEGPGVAPHKGE